MFLFPAAAPLQEKIFTIRKGGGGDGDGDGDGNEGNVGMENV